MKQGDLVGLRHIEGSLEDRREVVGTGNDPLVGTRVVLGKGHGDQVQQWLGLDLSSPIHLALALVLALFDRAPGKEGIRIDVEGKVVHR